jgi:DNA-binding PadR family transcriptional regulator
MSELKTTKGYLRIMVLSELSKNPSTGYDLMKSLSINLNKSPSPGSIYPLLSELLSEKMITVKEDGRKKIYSLTKKGSLSITKIIHEKELLILENVKLMLKFSEMLPDSCLLKTEQLKQELLKNPKLISSHIKDWDELKLLSIDLILDKDYSNKKIEIKKVIKETVNKLKKIKDK